MLTFHIDRTHWALLVKPRATALYLPLATLYFCLDICMEICTQFYLWCHTTLIASQSTRNQLAARQGYIHFTLVSFILVVTPHLLRHLYYYIHRTILSSAFCYPTIQNFVRATGHLLPPQLSWRTTPERPWHRKRPTLLRMPKSTLKRLQRLLKYHKESVTWARRQS